MKMQLRRNVIRTTTLAAICLLCWPACAGPHTVTSLADNGGAGTLRGIILDNGTVDGDTISFPAGLSGTITLLSKLEIDKALTIIGLGPQNSSIVNFNDQVFHLGVAGKPVFIAGFHVTGHVTTASGADGTFVPFAPDGISAATPATGGGIQLELGCILTVSNCFFDGCTAIAGNGGNAYDSPQNTSVTGNGGDGTSACGGGIYNHGGSLILLRCAFGNNSAQGGSGGSGSLGGFGGKGGFAQGGALCDDYAGQNLEIVNCTFYGNFASAGFGGNGGSTRGGGPPNGGPGGLGADASGGGIYFAVGCPMTNDCTGVVHDTISQNIVLPGGGGTGGMGLTANGGMNGISGANGSGYGGGMYHISGIDSGVIDVTDTIVAGNYANFRYTTGSIALNGPDVWGAYASHGYNCIGVVDANSSGWLAADFDIMGSVTAPLDARLGPFQDNGGETQTMAPLVCSPVIDAGTSANVNRDQIRQTRPVVLTDGALVGDGSDIGAFELQTYPAIGNVLSVALSGNNVVISWPSYLSCFVLKQNSNLNSPNWAPVPNIVTMSGTLDQVTITTPTGHMYYRLFLP